MFHTIELSPDALKTNSLLSLKLFVLFPKSLIQKNSWYHLNYEGPLEDLHSRLKAFNLKPTILVKSNIFCNSLVMLSNLSTSMIARKYYVPWGKKNIFRNHLNLCLSCLISVVSLLVSTDSFLPFSHTLSISPTLPPPLLINHVFIELFFISLIHLLCFAWSFQGFVLFFFFLLRFNIIGRLPLPYSTIKL